MASNDSCGGEDTPQKKKHCVEHKKFQNSWLDDSVLRLFVEKCSDNTKAKCKVCNKVMAAGKSELLKHAEGKFHIKNMKALDQQKPIDQFFKTDTEIAHETKVKIAEIKLACFFADHNVAVQVVDHLIPLLKDIIDDSKIIKDIKLKRTKCTQIIKNILGRIETEETVKELQETKFSILVDESTDIADHKNLCVLVRFWSKRDGKIKTKLLELIKLNAASCTAKELYCAFKNCLQSYNISLGNIIGVASDGCNTMTGKYNSFFSHLKEDVPDVILISCICHSSAIVASKACERLPRSPEELLRSIATYISGSAKRCAVLVEIQEYFQLEKKKILKLATTRWLSRQACVVRILENYAALQHYFQLAVVEDKMLSAENILTQLNNVCNKAYLFFLKYVLNMFNAFNALFQSRKCQIHVLHSQSVTLMRQICQNFLKLVIVVEQDLGKLDIKCPHNYLPLEKIYLGNECQETLQRLPHEAAHDVRINCLNFYITAACELQKRLPLSSNFFKDISFVDPSVALTEKASNVDICNVLHEFKNIENVDYLAIELEYRNLRVSLDHNKIVELQALPIDQMWHEISNFQTFEGIFAFKNISMIAKIVISLPHSNAEAERIFSVVTDIKNKKRNRIGSEVLNSLCLVRNALQDKNIACYQYKVSKRALELFSSKCIYSKDSN